MFENINIPKIVNMTAIVIATLTDILLAGKGRFWVLFINASGSLSIIWLNAFDAPTIQYPPTANNVKVL